MVYAAVFKLLAGEPSDAVISEFHGIYSAKRGRLELPPKFGVLFIGIQQNISFGEKKKEKFVTKND